MICTAVTIVLILFRALCMCIYRVTNAAESDKVSFLEASNIVFMGCNVVEGEGTGIVIATGPNNQVSHI